MSRIPRTRRRGQATFRCRHCRLDVPIDAPGTMHRNHCPSCLWSRHLDEHVPGDRAAACAGSMEPIAVSVDDEGEWALVHRCRGCATVRVNRIAGDDNAHVLMRLAARPLARPPFGGVRITPAPSGGCPRWIEEVAPYSRGPRRSRLPV